MLYNLKIDVYLKILTDEEVKDFEAINFNEHFKSVREEQNIGKNFKPVYILLTTSDEVEKYVQSNSNDN